VQVVYKRTDDEFEAAYRGLKEKYSGQPRILQYLDHNKYPKRQQFAKPWTSSHRHFGHIATSRGEAGHASFKRYLQGNRHDLLDLKDKWAVMMKVWRNDFLAQFAAARDRPAHELKATDGLSWIPSSTSRSCQRA
jgi:hypothetical protein